MALTIDLDTGRTALLASIDGLLEAIDGMSELELLEPSACFGWTRLDVVTHLIFGGVEQLMGVATRVDEPPTVDAASYWRSYAELTRGEDRVEELMAQRRRGSSYARPESARVHLRDVFAAVRAGVRDLDERHVAWQGEVFTAGDFTAVWAVEHAVHHLDLLVTEPPPSESLRLARATVDALLRVRTPQSWDDIDAVLIGSGRQTARRDGPIPEELPVLG